MALYVEGCPTIVKRCEKCKKFSPIPRKPSQELLPLASPWPFAQWGLDIVGPSPRAPGNKKFLLVASDYFSKWVEAEPLAHIRDNNTRKFIWRNIITRFGIPNALISDKRLSLIVVPSMLATSIMEFGLTPEHYPQSNGQAEISNKTILDGIKKRLEDVKGRWVEELSSVL